MDSAKVIACILIAILIGLDLVKSEHTGQKSENKSAEATGPINVIILTYSRSGSSFAGELFSSHPSASYFFEPLYYPAIKIGNATSEAYNDVITKLLTCDTAMLDQVRADPIMVIIRKFGSIEDRFLEPKYNSQRVTDLCEASTNRVMKTIRLQMADALKIIADGNIPNLKIVHLVRDPRARYNSMLNDEGFWTPTERTVDSVCGGMERDLRLVESVPPSQYKLVKYEDLVANPEAVVKDFFANLLGIQTLPEETMHYIRNRTVNSRSRMIAYYSTYRDRKFVPDHWEHDLNQTTIETLQDNPFCKYVINKLRYPMKQFK